MARGRPTVDLRRGRNQFDVNALDPETGKRSGGHDPACSSRCRSSQIEAPTLTVDQPSEGASFENGAIPVARQGDERRVRSVVSAAYVGPSGPPRPAAGARPLHPRRRPRSRVTVGDDGAYSTPFELTAGRWTITVTASGARGQDRPP